MKAAVLVGDAKKLAELIRQDPGFKVNMDHGYGYTLLHFACGSSNRSPVIPLLLAHPDIDVNLKNDRGETPIYVPLVNGFTSCVGEMLKDSRVKVNEPDTNGFTPLFWAAGGGRVDIIKWCIASGNEMDLREQGDEWTDVIGAA